MRQRARPARVGLRRFRHVAAGVILACAAPCLRLAADPVLPEPVADATASPNNNVGFLESWTRRGTGSVASNRAVVVTAAHMFYNETGNVAVPDGSMWWVFPQGRTNAQPAGPDKTLRTHVVYTGPSGYAAMVQAGGQTSSRAFNQDLAITYGYEDIVAYDPLVIPNNSLSMLQSNRDKTIIGYAGSFYQDTVRPSNSPDAELLHATKPANERFDSTGGATPNFRFVIGTVNNTPLIASPGGSGSPLLVKENGTEWRIAGVVVAATPELQIGPGMFAGAVGVRVFATEDVDALITPLLPTFAQVPTITQDLTAGSTALVGDSVVLNFAVDGWRPMTIAWFKDGQPLPDPSVPGQLALYNITTASAGTYTARATNRNGSVTSRGHLLTVTRSPVVTAQPAAASVGYGNWVTFSCQFRGEAPFAIQWYHGDEPVPGATSSYFYSPSPATFADEGPYRAKITNAFGEAWTSSATLTVNIGPAFAGSIVGATHNPVAGDRVVLSPSAAVEPETQFQWRFNGQAIAGATDRVLDLGRIGPADFGAYSLSVTHPRGAIEMATFALNPPATPAFADPASARLVQPGDAIRLGRQLHAAAVTSYRWFKDGVPMPGASAATLDLAPVTNTSAGDYTLQAVTPQATITSQPIAVRIGTHPFWTEIPLLAATPARSGGVAGGQVFLFGERWRTAFVAGTMPDHVDAWLGASDLTDFCAGNGAFAALGSVPGVGNVVYRSANGTTWQSEKPRGLAPVALAFGNGKFVAGPLNQTAPGAPAASLTSTDAALWNLGAVTWAGGSAPAAWSGAAMAFGTGRFVALDLNDRVIGSIDGTNWAAIARPTGANVARDLAYHGSRFVGVANASAVSYSNDGLTWIDTTITAAEPVILAEIVGGDGWFAARTNLGRLALSRDGIGWELVTSDGFDVQRLVGIAGGRLYAIRPDGVPLVSRPLGTIALVTQPTRTLRVAGLGGSLGVDATNGGTGLTYQWYRGPSGDTSAPIAGATGAQLAIAPGGGVVEAWARMTDGSFSRDSATGRSSEMQPGWFFSELGVRRVGAWLRTDGTLTWLGRDSNAPTLHHLRREAAFDSAAPMVRSTTEFALSIRSSEFYYAPLVDDTGVTYNSTAIPQLVRLDDTTRVTGTRPTGYFRGGIPAQRAAELDALALPDGRVVIGLQTPDDVLAGDAIAATNGEVQFDFGPWGLVQLAFDHAAGRFSGTWTRTGSPTQTLRGVREASDGGIVLANLSGRTWLPGAGHVTIGGFVVQGTGPQRVVARGIGPTLRDFNVLDAAAHPTIRLFSGPTQLLENTRWSTDPRAPEIASVGGRLGAFALDPAKDDSASIAELAPGAYTFHVLDPTGGGTVLAELYYDQSFSGDGRLVNLSTRGWVDNAGAVVIAGFAITGDGPRQILVRGVGPGLQPFGLTDAAAAVSIELFRGPQSLIPKTGWAQLAAPTTTYGTTGEPYMRTAMAAVGAFPLTFEPGSDDDDAALLVWLDPGAYTLVVRNARGSGGTALAEVYDVPFDAAR